MRRHPCNVQVEVEMELVQAPTGRLMSSRLRSIPRNTLGLHAFTPAPSPLGIVEPTWTRQIPLVFGV
jgi:hypothetical protein